MNVTQTLRQWKWISGVMLLLFSGCAPIASKSSPTQTQEIIPSTTTHITGMPSEDGPPVSALTSTQTQEIIPSPTKQITATPTRPPTATPTDEVLGVLVHGVLVHYADIRTGLDDVDQIIDVVLAVDIIDLRQRIKFSMLGCTHEMALGGPPNCRVGEPEGALVEVLPFLGSEGNFLRRDEIYKWQGIDVAGLYAVYRVSDEAYSPKEYPAGEYGIVFRLKDPNEIVTLQVENGRILRVDYQYGLPPEVNFERDAQETILTPPDINSGCPGAASQRVAIGLDATVCTISDDLIVRKGPGLDSRQLTGIEPGANFMIIDGPACANNWFWWKVELDSGLEGWVAEGGDNIDPYFICPVD
ncbi:MAG TPA: SH3 domain-containing protein [Anaerolineales bacterium]|nr:SH3 domain-containing protein [Anaerolineales bacterium]